MSHDPFMPMLTLMAWGLMVVGFMFAAGRWDPEGLWAKAMTVVLLLSYLTPGISVPHYLARLVEEYDLFVGVASITLLLGMAFWPSLFFGFVVRIIWPPAKTPEAQPQ